ncbi:Vacuolar protein sorting-associated protein 55 [Basidiobolus ranarum]|uniref:Vacuolar protein sorting-associated protein 55 n=1 Tax=Basidiobolus ranarum TaxID=34480 RepID=A0ABR2WM35_9FUNG
MFSYSYLHSIISLAFLLAIGFLLSILSCALYQNWWPLFVVFTYALAPLPNFIFGRCGGGDDLMSDSHGAGFLDAGRFITAIFIVTGFGLPMVLAHAGVITMPAMLLSISGGILVYGTIITYSYIFRIDDSF